MIIHITRDQNDYYTARADEDLMIPVTFSFANKSKMMLTKQWLETLAQLMYNWQRQPNRNIRRMSQKLWAYEGNSIRDSNAADIAKIMNDNRMRFMPHEPECQSNVAWELLYERVHIIDSLYNFILELKEQDLETTEQSAVFVVEKQFKIAEKLRALIIDEQQK